MSIKILNNRLQNKYYIDKQLFILVMLLAAFGTVVLYSASSIISLHRYNSDMYFLIRHTIWMVTGILLASISYLININWIKNNAVKIFYLIIGLVVLGFILNPGLLNREPSRWLIYIDSGKKITTSDFAKLALLIFTAWYFEKNRKKLNDFNEGLKPFIIPVGILILLIALQPDMSTALVMSTILFLMLFIAGVSIKKLTVIIAIPIPLITSIILFHPHMISRVKGWLWLIFPDVNQIGVNQTGVNWQVFNAITAMGSGGLKGRGFGDGVMKAGHIPEIQTDFVFSVIGEEFGLFVEILVLSCFLILFARGIFIAKQAKDPFSMFLAIGISVNFIVYTLINVGYVTGLLPTTGLPLPFISYGGSHTWINFIMVGLLLNIAKEAKLIGR